MDNTAVRELPGRQELDAHVGSRFEVPAGNGTAESLELELTGLEDLRGTPGNEQFSLTFLGPAEMPVQQGVYHLEHPTLGPLDLFLVPIGREAGGLVLEAVFNRFIDVEKE
jgi:hypothetical protein